MNVLHAALVHALQALHFGAQSNSPNTPPISDNPMSNRRRHWKICNIVLGSLYLVLFFSSSTAIWIRIFMHKNIMRDRQNNSVHSSHPYIRKIKINALKFHLTVLIMLWASSVCGVAASFARAFAFHLPYGWRLCYGCEFISSMLFFNAALRIAFFWSSLATKTFNKDWYRKWSSRVCSFVSFSLMATVNGAASGILLIFMLPLVNMERHAFSFTVAIFTCILSLVMSLSFILYGLVLLRYFHGKKIRKLFRLSLLTMLTTSSFFVMCLMNLLSLVIIHSRKSNLQLQEAGPFVYLGNNALCHILVSLILCWFFGCAAAPSRVISSARSKARKLSVSKMFIAESDGTTSSAAKPKVNLTVDTDVALLVPGSPSANVLCDSATSNAGLTPLKTWTFGSEFSGMSISSGNTIMTSGQDSPFPASVHNYPFSVLHEMAASAGSSERVLGAMASPEDEHVVHEFTECTLSPHYEGIFSCDAMSVPTSNQL